VNGVLLPFPDADTGRDLPAGFRTTWFRFNGAAIRGQYQYPVAPVYLQATERPTGGDPVDTARTLPVILDPPTVDAGPHLSYAIQWFSFATILFLGWIVLLARRDDGTHAER
jgi:surfeit locus 1 family protein